MKYAAIATMGLLAVAACATTSGSGEEPRPGGEQPEDGGGPMVEPPDADAGTADVIELDAERALACGDAGFCETRLPTSNLGMPPSLQGVWSVGPNDVWSVSAEGAVLHYDGSGWTAEHQANYELRSVWATAGDVWVGGEGGLLLHRPAGGPWQRVETGHTKTIASIFGTSSGDVWITSRAGFVDHFDGSTLTTFPLGVPDLELTTVFGRAGASAYAAGRVRGARPPSGVGVVDHVPYLFALATGNVAIFNTALSDKMGFVPAAGVVADVDASQQVFVVGYLESESLFAGTTPATSYDGKVVRLDRDATADLVDAPLLSSGASVAITDVYVPPTLSMWGPSFHDLRIPVRLTGLVRWNGAALEEGSLGMGYDHVPALARAIHGDATNMWVVGDGFALKGPLR